LPARPAHHRMTVARAGNVGAPLDIERPERPAANLDIVRRHARLEAAAAAVDRQVIAHEAADGAPRPRDVAEKAIVATEQAATGHGDAEAFAAGGLGADVVGEARDAEPRVLARNDRHVAVPELLARLESGDQVELVKAVEAREATLQTDDVEQLAGLGKLQAARKEIALRICEIADRKLA